MLEKRKLMRQKFGKASQRQSMAALNDQLLDAAIFGNLALARKLLAKGADPNAENSLALCLAISREDMPMLLEFLKKGSADAHGETPLRVAVTEDRLMMACTLIKHGASFEKAEESAQKHGDTAEQEKFRLFRKKHGEILKYARKNFGHRSPRR